MPNSRLNIPSVNDLLESPPLKSLVNRVSHNVVVDKARRFLDEMRSQVQSAAANVPTPVELAQRIADWISSDQSTAVVPVINATGILVNDDLGGVPLADPAIQSMAAVAGAYTSEQLNLASGEQAEAGREVEDLLIRQVGVEAACVLNSNTAALWQTLASVAQGREVIASRGHLIQTANGCRLHDLIGASGAVLREVGSVNCTTAAEYEAAITPQTAALLYVNASHCAITGTAGQTRLQDVVSIGRRRDVPVLAWVEHCAGVDLSRYGLTDEPVLSQIVGSNADLIILPGDRFLGGPPCGIIVGRRDLIQRMKSHSLMTVAAAGKVTLAALAATLRLYDDIDLAERSVPLLSLLATPLDNLRQRAERLAPQVSATGVASAEIVPSQAPLICGAAVGRVLPSVSLALTPLGRSVDQLATALRSGTPSVVAANDNGRLLINLRSVQPRDDLSLMAAIEAQRPEKPAQSPPSPAA